MFYLAFIHVNTCMQFLEYISLVDNIQRNVLAWFLHSTNTVLRTHVISWLYPMKCIALVFTLEYIAKGYIIIRLHSRKYMRSYNRLVSRLYPRIYAALCF